MALDGRREIADARRLLGHELADCLWAVLVLADKYGVDLVAEFTVGLMEDSRWRRDVVSPAELGPPSRLLEYASRTEVPAIAPAEAILL